MHLETCIVCGGGSPPWNFHRLSFCHILYGTQGAAFARELRVASGRSIPELVPIM